MSWWKNLNTRVHTFEQQNAETFKAQGGNWKRLWLGCVLTFAFALWWTQDANDPRQDWIFYVGLSLAFLACAGFVAYYLKQLYKHCTIPPPTDKSDAQEQVYPPQQKASECHHRQWWRLWSSCVLALALVMWWLEDSSSPLKSGILYEGLGIALLICSAFTVFFIFKNHINHSIRLLSWTDLNQQVHAYQKAQAEQVKAEGGSWWKVWLVFSAPFALFLWWLGDSTDYPKDWILYGGLAVAFLVCIASAAYYLKQLYK